MFKNLSIGKRYHFDVGQSYLETPPTMYIDFFVLKSNLKRHWRDHNTFQFEVGLFGKCFGGSFYWGFVERERTESEEEQYERTLNFIEALNEHGLKND